MKACSISLRPLHPPETHARTRRCAHTPNAHTPLARTHARTRTHLQHTRTHEPTHTHCCSTHERTSQRTHATLCHAPTHAHHMRTCTRANMRSHAHVNKRTHAHVSACTHARWRVSLPSPSPPGNAHKQAHTSYGLKRTRARMCMRMMRVEGRPEASDSECQGEQGSTAAGPVPPSQQHA